LPKRSVLITGASSGIGYAAAHHMRERGWRVFAACRKPEDCNHLRVQGFDAPLIDYDDSATIHTGLAAVLDQTGGTLNAVFNNGAYACPGAVEDLPREALEAIFSTNLFGVHELTRAVIPAMRAQGHGRIVNCSSVLGLVGLKWRGAYVATNFAMEGLTDVLRLEMHHTGIRIVLIEPGPVTSKIRENAIPHFERWIDWKGSARSAEYETLLKRLHEPDESTDRFELPPAAVCRRLEQALESPRPRPRYYVTTPTYLAGNLRRILGTRLLDMIMRRN
jgi:NAD(P)-dependent dehydrogenase (short-subunit alcohol dehydrogenase family)